MLSFSKLLQHTQFIFMNVKSCEVFHSFIDFGAMFSNMGPIASFPIELFSGQISSQIAEPDELAGFCINPKGHLVFQQMQASDNHWVAFPFDK